MARRDPAEGCVVLAQSYQPGTWIGDQAERLVPHYRAWCESIGCQPDELDGDSLVATLALWVSHCKLLPELTTDPR